MLVLLGIMARVWIARKPSLLLAAKVGLIYSFTNSNLIRGSFDVTASSPIALMESEDIHGVSVYLAEVLGEARTEGGLHGSSRGLSKRCCSCLCSGIC